MKLIKNFFPLFLALVISSVGFSQTTGAPVNYLNTASSISFNNTSYSLVWASHPTPEYYKQEYIPKGEPLNKFTNMLLVEVLASGTTHKDAMNAKVEELKQMKATNPYVNYENFYNAEKDEYILDFMLTANAQNGKDIAIAERNIYRYKKFTGKNGASGVLLFGVSKRSYGSEAIKFIAAVNAGRQDLVNKVKQFTVPAVTIK